jgi:hypothetical protein
MIYKPQGQRLRMFLTKEKSDKDPRVIDKFQKEDPMVKTKALLKGRKKL